MNKKFVDDCTMKPMTCWAVHDGRTLEPFVYTVSQTRREAILKFTSGFTLWKAYYREGYRVSKFKLVPKKKS